MQSQYDTLLFFVVTHLRLQVQNVPRHSTQSCWTRTSSFLGMSSALYRNICIQEPEDGEVNDLATLRHSTRNIIRNRNTRPTLNFDAKAVHYVCFLQNDKLGRNLNDQESVLTKVVWTLTG